MRRTITILLLWFVSLSSIFAGQILKQSTATQVTLKFVDATDGVTAETGLTVTTFDCNLVKHADSGMAATALTVTASSGSNDSAHLADGIYSLELTATDTNTLGRLDLYCQCSGAAPYEAHFEVVASASYDSSVSGSVSTIDDFWEYATASITSSSGIGYQVKTNLNIPVSSVWNELLADHTTASTFGSQLSTTNLGAAVWASTIETNYTAKAIMRIISAALAGKLSGVNINAPVFRDLNDSKNRITMTTGSTGRSAVTLDATD